MLRAIVNDVSYVMPINHEIHFAWQAQYLVRLEGDACGSLVNHVFRCHFGSHGRRSIW